MKELFVGFIILFIGLLPIYLDNRKRKKMLKKEKRRETMKKSDLKAGYLLEFENGDLGVLMPMVYLGKETLAIVYDLESCGCQQILDLDEDFIEFESRFREGRVARVYGLHKTSDNRVWLEITKENRPLLWERKKTTKELTVKEISDLLGYNIKVVK